MTPPLILTEKLRRPEPSGLGRRRLAAPLLAGTAGSRLDLVVGPPGSGKTTLLAQVCAAATVPVAWYRLTADDISEATLVAHLGRALQDALGIPISCVEVTALLEALEQWTGRSALLALDDVHEIVGTAAERTLERFVALRPGGIRVLIGSRRQPDLNVPRLRLSGQLNEISSDDLRFRSWEVEELFISVFRAPLSPESAAALTRRTGGWAAGLQLFHLATRGRSGPDRQRAVTELNGRSKLLRSYLARNVIEDLPEQWRQFLMKTSTLGTLSGELCDALLETTGSGRILDELEHQQLFTSSDDDGQTFRYHEVLRAHLEWALVEEVGPERARSWYSRSAALLESSGKHHAAIRAHAKAEDWGAVARLIQSRGSAPADTSAGMDLLLPVSVVQYDPWLSLAEARRLIRQGSLADAALAFQQAENLLDEPAFRDSCRRERSVALLWSAVTDGSPGLPLQLQRRPPHWSVAVREASERPQPGSATPGSLRQPVVVGDLGNRLGAGLATLLSGDLRGAKAILSGVADAAVDPTHQLLAKLAAAVADILIDGGDDPAGRLGRIALEAEFAGLPWVERLSRGLAEAVLVALGEPAWRVTACQDVVSECERAGDEWGAALIGFALAMAMSVGDPAAGIPEFADPERRFVQLQAPVPALWAAAFRAGVGLHLGGPAALDEARRVAASARAHRLPAAEAMLLGASGAGGTGWLDQVPALFRDRLSNPATERAAVRVSVRCFGTFVLEIDELPVDLTALRPRARTVLRLLAVAAGAEVHQEYLVDALWPGVGLAIGIRRLQVAVSSIRQLLERHGLTGAEWLRRRGSAYCLVIPRNSQIDVAVFRERLLAAGKTAAGSDLAQRIAAREQALALYQGELLAEEGAAEYVVAERERFRLDAADAATALAIDCRAAGQISKAVAAATLSVRLERLQDAAWVLLVALHESTGDHTTAERIRREHLKAQAELEPAW